MKNLEHIAKQLHLACLDAISTVWMHCPQCWDSLDTLEEAIALYEGKTQGEISRREHKNMKRIRRRDMHAAIDQREKHLERMRGLEQAIREARRVLHEAPELNMSNYDEDQVAALNAGAIEAYWILQVVISEEPAATEGSPEQS